MTIELGTTATTETLNSEPAARRHGWLPILVVLFLISYGLMTMLIVEQGRTIESQRVLIHDLFKDSTELSAARMRAQQDRVEAAQSASTTTPSSQIPYTQNPSTQIPAVQAPTKSAPSSQAGAKRNSQNQNVKPKSQVPVPTRPASDINDTGRSLITL